MYTLASGVTYLKCLILSAVKDAAENAAGIVADAPCSFRQRQIVLMKEHVMSGSFQEEIPKARINLKLNLH
ncbi:hypothetical protein ROM83_12330, partial [Cronobacter sakazakii]|nr:hypothetical protein [Cronobacter sakazakii]